MAFDHLHPAAVELLALPAEERMPAAWKGLWLGYPTALDIHARLEAMLCMPQAAGPRCLLLWGPARNGKTTLLDEFVRRHPAVPREDADAVEIPVIKIDAPVRADERRFWCAVLREFGAVFRPTEPMASLESQALALFRRCHVRMLMIDELHNILVEARRDRQRAFLVVVKELCNHLQIPVIAAGTEEARTVLRSDPQLDGRFSRTVLPAWRFGDEFRRLLATFERMIPFPEPSRLSAGAMARRIHSYTDGTMGKVSGLLYDAACLGAMRVLPCITEALIDEAQAMSGDGTHG
ncbi:TniB family NTP-binding protein [Azospirillum sp. sgz302134]